MSEKKKEWRVESVLGTDDNATIARNLEDRLNELDVAGYYMHKFFRNGNHFLLVAYNSGEPSPEIECDIQHMDDTGIDPPDEELDLPLTDYGDAP